MKKEERQILEKKLISRIKKGDKKAKEELIKQNQGLIVCIAKKYASSPDMLSDLIAEGNIGLLTALERYNSKKKVKFSTYAYFWIKRFILRAIIKEFEIFKIPDRIYEFRGKFGEIKRKYQLKYGRDPTDYEMSEELRIPINVIKKLKKYTEHINVISSDLYVEGEKKGDIFEISDFRKKERGDWEILRDKDILEKIFSRLKKKEKRADIEMWFKILKLHFGIDEKTPYSYNEIAKQLNISRQRVHQIVKLCLEKMHKEWTQMKNKL